MKITIKGYEEDKTVLPLNYSDLVNHFRMPDSMAKDSLVNSSNFKGYRIIFDIENNTGRTLYDLKANLNKMYNTVWNNRVHLAEWEIDLQPKQIHTIELFIIVKTDEKSEAKIDELIRSVGITVSISQFDNPILNIIRNKKTVYFDN